GEDHDPRRRLADTAARRHQSAGADAVALERRQPLHPALAGTEQRAGAARRRDQRSHRPRPAVNTLDPKTRKGLAEFIQGNAAQYVGAGKELGESTEYFGPFLSASNHFFAELVRDQPVFTHFLIETAKAVTTIGARAPQLSSLIENANTTFTAIGNQQESFAKGLKELPVTLQEGNNTFKKLPATFKALETLVVASKPTTQPLIKLLNHLNSLVQTGQEPITNFSEAFSRPGPNNDLTDIALVLPKLYKQLTTASPAVVQG